ncbi:galactokinase [Streptomyces sp. TM32]|uniref:galactokinase n=1 Tax=Streptomyces sp. TM32 TaxID=1652669 RepID=UPI0020B130E6|nr:galactokinase [Streptomyces sp. TM32]
MSAVDLARRATADPLLRLLAHGFATTYRRPPGAVWRAPYAFRLAASAVEPGTPLTAATPRTDWVAAANWYVAAAVSPRADGLLRCGSLNHPAESAELPLTGPAARAPGWAARPYAVLRALAAAGFGRGGADLHVNATLPDAVGLPVAEPLECAVALALADAHVARGARPLPRAQLAELLGAAVPGDHGLRRAVLFGRTGQLLAADGSARRPLRSPDGGPAPCLLLLTARTATGSGTEDTGAAAVATGLATAVREALRAGARSACWPGTRPGRSVLLLMPPDRRAAVRTAVIGAFRRCGLPVPRLLRIAVAAAARRED